MAPKFDPYVSPTRRAAQRRLAELDLIDMREISVRLGVAEGTPVTWRTRGLLPEPDLHKGDNPLWLGLTIDEWAERTNRYPKHSTAARKASV